MKSILYWKEEDVSKFFNNLKINNLYNIDVKKLTGYSLLKLGLRELKDEFKLKLEDRHTLLNELKKEEIKSIKLKIVSFENKDKSTILNVAGGFDSNFKGILNAAKYFLINSSIASLSINENDIVFKDNDGNLISNELKIYDYLSNIGNFVYVTCSNNILDNLSKNNFIKNNDFNNQENNDNLLILKSDIKEDKIKNKTSKYHNNNNYSYNNEIKTDSFNKYNPVTNFNNDNNTSQVINNYKDNKSYYYKSNNNRSYSNNNLPISYKTNVEQKSVFKIQNNQEGQDQDYSRLSKNYSNFENKSNLVYDNNNTNKINNCDGNYYDNSNNYDLKLNQIKYSSNAKPETLNDIYSNKIKFNRNNDLKNNKVNNIDNTSNNISNINYIEEKKNAYNNEDDINYTNKYNNNNLYKNTITKTDPRPDKYNNNKFDNKEYNINSNTFSNNFIDTFQQNTILNKETLKNNHNNLNNMKVNFNNTGFNEPNYNICNNNNIIKNKNYNYNNDYINNHNNIINNTNNINAINKDSNKYYDSKFTNIKDTKNNEYSQKLNSYKNENYQTISNNKDDSNSNKYYYSNLNKENKLYA